MSEPATDPKALCDLETDTLRAAEGLGNLARWWRRAGKAYAGSVLDGLAARIEDLVRQQTARRDQPDPPGTGGAGVGVEERAP